MSRIYACYSVQRTYSKEDPLQLLAVVVGLGGGIEGELFLLVIVLFQVQQNRCGLKDVEVVATSVYKDRDTAIGVELDEPRLLLPVG